jgi:hypothetical protein
MLDDQLALALSEPGDLLLPFALLDDGEPGDLLTLALLDDELALALSEPDDELAFAFAVDEAVHEADDAVDLWDNTLD